MRKRRDRTLRMRVGLNDLVLEKAFCVLSLRKNKNRETIIEEKHYNRRVKESCMNYEVSSLELLLLVGPDKSSLFDFSLLALIF